MIINLMGTIPSSPKILCLNLFLHDIFEFPVYLYLKVWTFELTSLRSWQINWGGGRNYDTIITLTLNFALQQQQNQTIQYKNF